jgi:hypothetical protein
MSQPSAGRSVVQASRPAVKPTQAMPAGTSAECRAARASSAQDTLTAQRHTRSRQRSSRVGRWFSAVNQMVDSLVVLPQGVILG